MPRIQITDEAHAQLKLVTRARGCTIDAALMLLLQKALPPFDPVLMDVYEVHCIKVVYYAGKFAGVGRLDAYVGDKRGRDQRPHAPSVEWCDWFAPVMIARGARGMS